MSQNSIISCAQENVRQPFLPRDTAEHHHSDMTLSDMKGEGGHALFAADMLLCVQEITFPNEWLAIYSIWTFPLLVMEIDFYLCPIFIHW